MSGTCPVPHPQHTKPRGELLSVSTAETWADRGHAGYRVDDPVAAEAVPCAGPCRLVVDQRTGPRTIVGPGEYCLLCEDELEPGAVYLFVGEPGGRHGVVHEACLEG